jgi:hypothetical protein
MNACWSVTPGERKSFAVIVQIFKKCRWKFWNDVETRVVTQYVEKIEHWEKQRVGSCEEEKPSEAG